MQFNKAEYLSSFFKFKDIPTTGLPEIAFAGRSNVGKSTLINKVLNRKKLVQVSKTPGKTKALNYFAVDNKYHFVDLPGFGYAKVPLKEKQSWGKLIENYLKGSPNLKGLVHIIDSRRGLMESDWTLIEFVSYIHNELGKDLNVLYVLSKSDKLKSKARSDTYQKTIQDLGCDPRQLIFFSALSGQGVTEIRKIIAEILNE
jgi:GTP-binding protein